VRSGALILSLFLLSLAWVSSADAAEGVIPPVSEGGEISEVVETVTSPKEEAASEPGPGTPSAPAAQGSIQTEASTSPSSGGSSSAAKGSSSKSAPKAQSGGGSSPAGNSRGAGISAPVPSPDGSESSPSAGGATTTATTAARDPVATASRTGTGHRVVARSTEPVSKPDPSPTGVTSLGSAQAVDSPDAAPSRPAFSPFSGSPADAPVPTIAFYLFLMVAVGALWFAFRRSLGLPVSWRYRRHAATRSRAGSRWLRSG
jgi:hypothetical protein